MRPFKSTPPALTVIALSRLHIWAVCIVLLLILNWPLYPRSNAMRLSLPSDKSSSKKPIIFSMPSLMRQWQKEHRQFVQFNLTGDTEYDALTFCGIAYATRNSLESDDFTHIIKVHFNAGCTYGQFVRLCSIMRDIGQRRYAYDDDDFYIWQMPETASRATTEIEPFVLSFHSL